MSEGWSSFDEAEPSKEKLNRERQRDFCRKAGLRIPWILSFNPGYMHDREALELARERREWAEQNARDEELRAKVRAENERRAKEEAAYLGQLRTEYKTVAAKKRVREEERRRDEVLSEPGIFFLDGKDGDVSGL